MKKVAVVLFNLGGPTSLEGVKPFLFNLFKDKNIINLPGIVRYPLAWLISTLRTKKAQGIYAQLGGKSPLNENTQKQCAALENALSHAGIKAKVFMCMRYAPPMTDVVAKDVLAYNPDEIVLLPLYPQYSTTTTKSSMEAWCEAFKGKIKTHSLCCYPHNDGFIQAYQDMILEHLQSIPIKNNIKLLFSAHGLPQDIVDAGDPYAFQVEASTKAIMAHEKFKDIPYQICYQSKVGPKKWLTPSLDDAIQACAAEKVGAVVVPVSFVSDHSETLVELDIQYKEVADELKLPHYSRIMAVGDHPKFISGLAHMVQGMLIGEKMNQVCPQTYKMCGYDRFSF